MRPPACTRSRRPRQVTCRRASELANETSSNSSPASHSHKAATLNPESRTESATRDSSITAAPAINTG